MNRDDWLVMNRDEYPRNVITDILRSASTRDEYPRMVMNSDEQWWTVMTRDDSWWIGDEWWWMPVE
jgi:hypothetical protein